jgi:hypothetical protein
LALRFGLLATGGTDFHGPGSGREKALGIELSDRDYDGFMQRLSQCK